MARASGYACGLADDGDAYRESTLTLARDDAPIVGRVVDLEGRPVAGVSVKVMEVRLSIAGRTYGDEVSTTALKALNAVRPVSDPVCSFDPGRHRRATGFVAEGPRGPEGVGHPRLADPAQSGGVRDRLPRSSPTRRPVPTAGSGSPGSAAGGSPRSSSTGRRSRPRVSMPGPGRAPRSTSLLNEIPVRTRPGRSTARRSSTSPVPPGRSKASSATARPAARWPISWSTAGNPSRARPRSSGR